MEYVQRTPLAGDIPTLRRIWNAAFGGSDADIFFTHCFNPELAVCIECGTQIVSAGYLLPAGELTNGAVSLTCAMIYAVAALPEYRGYGLGAELVRALIEKSRVAGYPAAIICPAAERLFEYYKKIAGFNEYFYTCETQITCDSIMRTGNNHAQLTPVSENEYGIIREKLLRAIPHIMMKQEMLVYQNLLCRDFGGGLFKIESHGLTGSAVVERQENGEVFVKELLTAGEMENTALIAIAEAFPADNYLIRSPVMQVSNSGLETDSRIRRFGMISVSPEIILPAGGKTRGWFGMAFD